MTPEQASEILIAAFVAIVSGALQVPVVEPLVNLGKWILGYFGIEHKGNILLFIIAGVVTILMWLGRQWGFELQLNTVFGWLATVVPILLTLLTTLFGSKVLFAAAVKRDIPAFGYTRTP
jgi:hypothetical protein